MFSRIFRNNWVFLVSIIISIALLWLLETTSFFSRNEETVYLRVYEIDRCFQDGQIPCRWVQNVVGFYGSPFFNYHAPLPYYFGELVFKLTSNLFFSVKSVFVFVFIFSSIFIYLLTRRIWAKKYAVTVAILGSFIVYYILKLSNIEPIGKMWGLVFFTASLYSINRLKRRLSLKNILFAEILVAFLITSHQRSVFIFLPLVLVFIFIQFIKKQNIQFLTASFFSIILGILLSSFYLLPMLFEKNLVHKNYLPINVEERIPKAPQARYEILIGEAQINEFREGSNWIELKVNADNYTIVRLSQYYFPQWRVNVNGKEIPIEYKNNSMGLMTLILGKGAYTIYARLYDTPIRILANYITLMAMFITSLLFFTSFVRVRKWISYYGKGIN